MLGMTLAASNRAITNFSDEEPPMEKTVEAATEKLSIAAATGGEPTTTVIPAATMLTHLNNIVIHKRAPV